jgi:hypothetical protein
MHNINRRLNKVKNTEMIMVIQGSINYKLTRKRFVKNDGKVRKYT